MIDYNSGSSKTSPDERVAGRNVQLLLSMAAIRQQIQPPPASVSGTFWHIADCQLSKPVNTVADADKLQQAMNTIHKHVIAARHGEFPDRPSKPDSTGKCMMYCELSQLFRVRAYAAQGN